MNLELIGALNELEKERGISKEILLEAIETAIVSAYKGTMMLTLILVSADIIKTEQFMSILVGK